MTTNQSPEGTPADALAVVAPVKKSKLRRNVLIAGSAVGLLAIGTTLAANISLNGGNNVEFGQGVAATTACDSNITITPYSTFVNTAGSGSSKLTSIRFSGVDSSPGACAGKVFEIKAYDDNGQLALVNLSEVDFTYDPAVVMSSNDYDFVTIYNNNGVFEWTSGGSDGDDVVNDGNVGDPQRDLTNTSFTISFESRTLVTVRTPLASAAGVRTITVQTTDGL
jgi:hypothetical protein